MEDQQRSIHADSSDIASNNIELILDWPHFIGLGLNGCQDLSLSSQITYDNYKEPALSLLDLGT